MKKITYTKHDIIQKIRSDNNISLDESKIMCDIVLNADEYKLDYTTSFPIKHVKQRSCVSAYNLSPYQTWRTAFRECVKLESKVINRQKSEETDERLKVWTTVGSDKPFGEYAIKGARAGVLFGAKGDNLHLINDFNWLKEVFDATA